MSEISITDDTLRTAKEPLSEAVEMGADDILPEYNFSQSRSNKYAAQYISGSVVVTLDPDVADVFPNAVEANEALRSLASIIRAHESQLGKRKRIA